MQCFLLCVYVVVKNCYGGIGMSSSCNCSCYTGFFSGENCTGKFQSTSFIFDLIKVPLKRGYHKVTKFSGILNLLILAFFFR